MKKATGWYVARLDWGQTIFVSSTLRGGVRILVRKDFPHPVYDKEELGDLNSELHFESATNIINSFCFRIAINEMTRPSSSGGSHIDNAIANIDSLQMSIATVHSCMKRSRSGGKARTGSTVNHQLLRKLEACGVRGSSLQWFDSYLSDRTQCVEEMNPFSKPCSRLLPIISSAPQGSIVRPLVSAICK
ncbi:hypothetical protein J6590_010609 [Homalodisca vitripennis]|nr:hypothetical protein J6590_010609 [Homalodisca vitripennis]